MLNYVHQVRLYPEVLLVCLSHALSTANEEIMGLLLGAVDTSDPRNLTVEIFDTMIVQRLDRAPDRVEISPEQLASSVAYCDKLSETYNRRIVAVGWYHSHPRITVNPSHVDLRTQFDFQRMGHWVGLIVSVFDHDAATVKDRMRLTCFQATQDRTCLEIPLTIDDGGPLTGRALSAILKMIDMLHLEEKEAFEKSVMASDDTGSRSGIGRISALHNNAIYTKSFCKLIESLCEPILESLEARRDKNAQELQKLRQLAQSKKAPLNQNVT